MTPAQREKCRELWAAGRMRKHIAAEVGVSPSSVTDACRDLPKPVDYRGSHKKRKFGGFSHWSRPEDPEELP